MQVAACGPQQVSFGREARAISLSYTSTAAAKRPFHGLGIS